MKIEKKRSKMVAIVAGCLAVLAMIGLFTPLALRRTQNGGGSTGDGIGSSSAEPAYGYRNSDYAALYVQDGLVACYMAYSPASLSVETKEVDGGMAVKYIWKNYAQSGKDAELKGGSVWRVMDGGLGYRRYIDESGQAFGACVLPESYVDGTASTSFEVETVAKWLGLTSRDTGRVACISSSTAVFNTHSTFRLGVLHAGSFLTSSDAMTADRTNRWYLSKEPVSTHPSGDTSMYDRVFRNNAWEADLYAMTMNVSFAAASNTLDVGYRFKGEFGNAFNVATSLWAQENDDVAYSDTVSKFTLFNEYPCVLYAVRVYDRTLTEEEKLLNSFVDLLAYYEVNAVSILSLNEETRTEFLQECAELADLRNVVMGNTDETVTQENREALRAIISECWPA